jgi:hypothetical protein
LGITRLNDTGQNQSPRKSPLFSGLTGKVLALAAIFLMVGELLVFVPSIANFRINWLKQRVAMAEIAALSVEAAEDRGVSEPLRAELLEKTGVRVLVVRRNDARKLVLSPDTPPMIDASFDLRNTSAPNAIMEAASVFMHGGNG